MKNCLRLSLAFIISNFLFFTSQAAVLELRYKREIIIQNGQDRIDNAVVEVLLEKGKFDYSKAKPDGSDVRFSIGNKLIGQGLNYWIEQWNDEGLTRIWLKIPVLKANQKLKLVMYYGDDNAQSVSDGTNTFLFFDDFETADLDKKWINTSVGEAVQQNGILKLKEHDGEDGLFTAKFDVTGKMIVRSSYQRGNADEHWTRAGIGAWNYFLCFGDHTEFAGTGTNYVMVYDAASLSSLTAPPLVKAANGKINGKWRRESLSYNGHILQGIQDNVKVEWQIPNKGSKLSLRVLDNDAWDNFAYISVSPFSEFEPTVKIGEQQQLN